jgi:hypothetical protein
LMVSDDLGASGSWRLVVTRVRCRWVRLLKSHLLAQMLLVDCDCAVLGIGSVGDAWIELLWCYID